MVRQRPPLAHPLDRLLPVDFRAGSDLNLLQRGRALVALLLFVMLHLGILAPFIIWHGRSDPSLVLLTSATSGVGLCITLLGLLIVARWGLVTAVAYFFSAVVTVLLTTLIQLTGGFNESPLAIQLLVAPIALFVVNGRRAGLALTTLATAAVLAMRSAGPWDILPPVPEATVMVIQLGSWVTAAAGLLACIWHLDYVNRVLATRVAHERDLAEFAAGHDPLTGLLNRRTFDRRLDATARRAALTGAPATLLLVDLDSFKAVNDSRGHQAGDQLLEALARRMLATVRQSDSVARLGGDEFALLLEGCADRHIVERIAAQLLSALSTPVACDRRPSSAVEAAYPATGDLQVSASIGVTFCPADASEASELIRCADAALYHAKSAGKKQAVFFSELPALAPA